MTLNDRLSVAILIVGLSNLIFKSNITSQRAEDYLTHINILERECKLGKLKRDECKDLNERIRLEYHDVLSFRSFD
jgi:hypothetical protein